MEIHKSLTMKQLHVYCQRQGLWFPRGFQSAAIKFVASNGGPALVFLCYFFAMTYSFLLWLEPNRFSKVCYQ